jgi:2,3-bisphosphoglycerate-dependent phosphoglycerate mutase
MICCTLGKYSTSRYEQDNNAMTQIYLVRHGDYIHQEKVPYDLGLSPEGITQAQRLHDRLAKDKLAADVLISSPWPRARETAEIIAPAINQAVKTNPDLEEWRNQGENSLTSEEIIRQYLSLPPDQRAFLSPGKDLETRGQFGFRICITLNKITQEYAGKNIVIVAHGGVIEASFVYCLGLSPLAAAPFMMVLDPKHTSITHWRKIQAINQWRLERYNDTQHLAAPSDDLSTG